jgi:hypothetical protein
MQKGTAASARGDGPRVQLGQPLDEGAVVADDLL